MPQRRAADTLQIWLRQPAHAANDMGSTLIGLAEAISPPDNSDADKSDADETPRDESPGSTLVAEVSGTPRADRRDTPPALSDPLTSRRTLGRFKLLDKLGEGGMGAVWRAQDPLDGRIVAIKVLRADMANKEILRKRFLHEARMLAEVNNP